jgi:hypothetical protein
VFATRRSLATSWCRTASRRFTTAGGGQCGFGGAFGVAAGPPPPPHPARTKTTAPAVRNVLSSSPEETIRRGSMEVVGCGSVSASASPRRSIPRGRASDPPATARRAFRTLIVAPLAIGLFDRASTVLNARPRNHASHARECSACAVLWADALRVGRVSPVVSLVALAAGG